MSEGEKMIWAAVYGASYIKEEDAKTAAQYADEAVEGLRDMAHVAKIIQQDKFGLEMVKEMLGD